MMHVFILQDWGFDANWTSVAKSQHFETVFTFVGGDVHKKHCSGLIEIV